MSIAVPAITRCTACGAEMRPCGPGPRCLACTVDGDYVEWKPNPIVCIHHTTGPGPRYPLRHGSWATVVCVNCGKWAIKSDHEKPYKPAIKWRDASELLIEIAIGRDDE